MGTLVRPEPRAINAPVTFTVPDRVLLTEGISPASRVIGVLLCQIARNGEQEVTTNNERLCRLCECSARKLDHYLTELEQAGLIFRLSRCSGRAPEDLKRLEAIGYRPDPALARNFLRIIVLLWRLPQPGEVVPDRLPLPAGR